jgi:hypothetical protein
MYYSWLFLKAARTLDAPVAVLLLLPTGAVAAPERLDCHLTQLETLGGTKSDQSAENQSITIVFDEQTHALTVYKDASARTLKSVTITQSSMSGFLDDISLGVDRSSWGIVFQTYASDSPQVEFGDCKLSAEPPP